MEVVKDIVTINFVAQANLNRSYKFEESGLTPNSDLYQFDFIGISHKKVGLIPLQKIEIFLMMVKVSLKSYISLLSFELSSRTRNLERKSSQ